MQESDSLVIFIVASLAGVAGAACIVVGIALGIVLISYNAASTPAVIDSAALEAMEKMGGIYTEAPQEESASAVASNFPETASSSQQDAPDDENTLRESAVDYNAAIEPYLQHPKLPGGCEVVSMTAVLKALGNEITAEDFADNYVLKIDKEPSMVNSYSGTPYESGAAFPPVMVMAGNNFLRSTSSEYRFVERKDASLTKLLQVVETGRPVLVWTTMGMASPSFTGDVIVGYRWYSNEHCVVLYGQNSKGDLLIMDPLEGTVERSRLAFEEIYDECGRHAITLTGVAAESIDSSELSE